MKKLILILLVTLLILTTFLNLHPIEGVNKGTKRKVLLELFTATWCGPCAVYSPYADQTFDIYGQDKVILVRNQVWDDGLDTEETNNRCNFYGVQGVPTLYVNGKFDYHPANYSEYRKKIDDILETTSPISINIEPLITEWQNLGVINLKLEVLDNISLKEPHLIVAFYEKLVNYEGPNKEKTHKFVIRDYINDEVGSLLNLKKGDILTFQFPLNLKQNINPNDFGVAVWIQDFKNFEVIQAESSNIKIISNPTPPIIISPKDNQIYIEKPTFKFLTNFKQIKLQISDNKNFSNIILDKIIDKLEFKFENPKENTKYYLRVRSIDGVKESDWSEIIEFTYNPNEKIYSFVDINYNLFGGSLTSIVQDPKNTNILYLGSYGGGIYKSVDRGESWFKSSFGLESLYVNSLDIDKNNTNNLVAGTLGGVYISFNGGNSWINYGLSNIQKVLLSSDSKLIYALTNYNLYKSIDYGKTWIDITPKFSDYYYLGAFSIDPKNSNKILLSSYHYSDSMPRLYLSSNGGSSWSEVKIKESKKYNSISCIEFDPNNSNNIYITLKSTGILKSQDGGKTFNLINSPYNWLDKIKINSINSNILYCSYYSELFISFDSGNNWISICRTKGGILDYINDLEDQDKIYLIRDQNEGLLISNNNGIIWESSNDGINSNKILGISNINEVIIQTNSGLYNFDNKNWIKRNSEYSNYGQIFVNSKYPNEIYYYDSNFDIVYYSDDSGLNWVKTITPLQNCWIVTLTVDFENKIIYAIILDWNIKKFRLFKVNLYNEWEEIIPSNLPLTYPPYDLFILIDPKDPNIIYVCTQTYWDRDSSGKWIIKGGGLYKSIDSGKTWKLISLKEESVYKLFIDPKDSKKIYANTNSGFKRSTDGGLTWKILFNENVDTMSFHPKLPVIYANRGRNLIKSEDDGLTWKYITWDYSVDPVKISKIISLAVDENDPDTVYIGTDGAGIYK
ncbi:MAG: VPS10 domain-containing protein, partial [Minisyncoccia bacterium]